VGGESAGQAFYARSGSFELLVDAASLLPGSSVRSFELTMAAGAEPTGIVQVQVRATGAQRLSALYFSLAYDPALYSPLAVEASPAIGSSSERLELALLSERGAVHFGEVLKNPGDLANSDDAGLSGDDIVATVTFAKQPCTAGRISSAAPSTPESQAPLMLEEEQLNLHWLYTCTGDYNQDGQVAVSDLTPIGLNFGTVAEGGSFPPATALAVIDGNADGVIGVQDLSAIGQNFKRKVTAYNVYRGSDVSQIPTPGDAASSLTPLGSIAFDAGSTNTALDRIALDFSLSLPPAEGDIYWVRPVDGSSEPASEGTPSQYDGVSVVIVAPNVKVIDGSTSDAQYSSEFELLSDDGETFVILDPAGGDSIFVGDILSGFRYSPVDGAAINGFLRRVTAVTPAGADQLTVETAGEVPLGEVFLKGGLTKSGLDFVDGKVTDYLGTVDHTGCAGTGSAASRAISGVRRRTSTSTVSFNADGVVLLDKREGDNFFKVSLPQANFSFGPSFDIDADFDRFLGVPYDLNSFHAIAQGGITTNLEILIDGHWFESFNEEQKVFNVRKDFYFMVGPVPVWLAGKLDVYAGVTGVAGVDCHARTGYGLDYSAKLGVAYHEDHGWRTIAELTDVFNTIPPELRVSGSADVQVYLRPEFSLELYGSIGGGIKMKPYMDGHIDGHYDLAEGPFCANWELNGGFHSDFFLYGKILGISLFDKSWNLFDEKFDIAGGQIGCEEGPQAPVAEMQLGGYWAAVDDLGPYTITFDATYYPPEPPAYPLPRGARDPDGGSASYPSGIVHYEWDLDEDGFCDYSGSEPVVTWVYPAKYTDYKATLWVTDEEGMVSTSTVDFQITNPIG
jgi:hypothetical protein